MSIGICRAQKVSGASGGVGAYLHNERIKDHSNTNPDIDFRKSAENYHIREYDSARTYNQRAEKRLAEEYKGKKAVRKDAVKLVEVLFTSDKAFFESQPDNGKAYFIDCLKWASERFGKDNIIADVVHLDEATPHMHLDFVPLTEDGRLSAKDVLGDKKKLQEMQDDFYEKVGKKYGLERGQRANLNAGESGRKNLTVQELKLKTLQEEIKNLSKLRLRIQNDVSGLQKDKADVLAKITDLEAKLDSLDANEMMLMRKFCSNQNIKPLFEKYCSSVKQNIQKRPEQRKSIRESLSRYQTEVDRQKQHPEKEEAAHPHQRQRNKKHENER
ncbi:MAG: plasmid recombination protein [Lachnospiraceae bacterium]|nr:plasmid recombination protein [Lachnospiraceae bacterium]